MHENLEIKFDFFGPNKHIWKSFYSLVHQMDSSLRADKASGGYEKKMAETKSMGVVGSGQMGSGIAQLGAVHGIDVWLMDSDPDALARASKSISSSIQRLVSKGLLSQVPSPTPFSRLLQLLLFNNWVIVIYISL